MKSNKSANLFKIINNLRRLLLLRSRLLFCTCASVRNCVCVCACVHMCVYSKESRNLIRARSRGVVKSEWKHKRSNWIAPSPPSPFPLHFHPHQHTHTYTAEVAPSRSTIAAQLQLNSPVACLFGVCLRAVYHYRYSYRYHYRCQTHVCA